MTIIILVLHEKISKQEKHTPPPLSPLELSSVSWHTLHSVISFDVLCCGSSHRTRWGEADLPLPGIGGSVGDAYLG
jgi:hypothetical protein